MGAVLGRGSVNIRRLAAGALYRGLTVAARHPTLAVSLARLRGYGQPLEPDTELVIEGFPRSGNTFAVAAFRRAQPRPVRVAHHLHAPGHAIAAVRAGVPALVIVRHPDEAVPEFATSKPNIPVGEILRGYVAFYEPLIPYGRGFVVAPFQEVLSDFGSVIRRLNARFSTTFNEFEATDEELRAAHADVERESRRRQGSAPATLGTSNRVSERERERLLERARNDYRQGDLAALRTRAGRLYAELLAEG